MRKRIKTIALQHLPYSLLNLGRQARGEYRKHRSYLLGATGWGAKEDHIEALKRGFLSSSDIAKYFKQAGARGELEFFEWGKAFDFYRNNGSPEKKINLLWADGPSPGNFGDWLSPYIINKLTGRRIELVDDYKPANSRHLVAIGSLAPAITKHAHVLGAGAATKTAKMDPDAIYHSVRGPYTAKVLENAGGKVVDQFGDLGFILSKLYRPKKRKIDAEVLLVRHMNHAAPAMMLPNGVMELSIRAAGPNDIESFVDALFSVGKVVTSAMHCFIVCQSYGIPCALVNFSELSNAVYGDGIKYADTMAGVGLRERVPAMVSLNCDFRNIDSIIFDDFVSDQTLVEIQAHASASLEIFLKDESC